MPPLLITLKFNMRDICAVYSAVFFVDRICGFYSHQIVFWRIGQQFSDK